MRIYLNQTRLNLICICIFLELLILLADIFLNFNQLISDRELRKVFNITREDSIANLFSSFQTSLTAICLWLIFFLSKKLSPMQKHRGWLISALFFSWMGIDDGIGLHERIGSAILRSRKSGNLLSNEFLNNIFEIFPSYPWQVVFIPLMTLAIGYLLYFWNNSFASTNDKLLIILAMLFFASAVAIDFIEGLPKNHFLNVNTLLAQVFASSSKNPEYLVTHFAKAIEEILEMVGNTLLFSLFFSKMLKLLCQSRLIENEEHLSKPTTDDLLLN